MSLVLGCNNVWREFPQCPLKCPREIRFFPWKGLCLRQPPPALCNCLNLRPIWGAQRRRAKFQRSDQCWKFALHFVCNLYTCTMLSSRCCKFYQVCKHISWSVLAEWKLRGRKELLWVSAQINLWWLCKTLQNPSVLASEDGKMTASLRKSIQNIFAWFPRVFLVSNFKILNSRAAWNGNLQLFDWFLSLKAYPSLFDKTTSRNRNKLPPPEAKIFQSQYCTFS